MKGKLCVAALLAGAMTCGAASAADLSRPMYTKAPPAPLPMAYNWTGWYLGVNVGGSWGHQDTTFNSAAGIITTSNNVNGVIGGGQIGYNWQLGSPWVFGIEADIQGSGQKSSGALSLATGPVALNYEDKLDWFGTVRGRLGYAIGDRGTWLPYITGGLAYGDSKISGSGAVAGTAVAFSNSDTRVGWTIGAGIEWAFADRWSAKLEYLHMDLGNDPSIALNTTPVTNISTGRLTDDIARVGVNLHF